ncbi:hypothetical protein ACRALDRAFT_2060347 [Sodiomyces alcalophilus JCM 7366]|uniref:uncharacterized protein n=1 Tax=Sodiomyces alcalophilus JCM 7366 TaxID=591952 RepID=UPI0039B47313
MSKPGCTGATTLPVGCLWHARRFELDHPRRLELHREKAYSVTGLHSPTGSRTRIPYMFKASPRTTRRFGNEDAVASRKESLGNTAPRRNGLYLRGLAVPISLHWAHPLDGMEVPSRGCARLDALPADAGNC